MLLFATRGTHSQWFTTKSHHRKWLLGNQNDFWGTLRGLIGIKTWPPHPRMNDRWIQSQVRQLGAARVREPDGKWRMTNHQERRHRLIEQPHVLVVVAERLATQVYPRDLVRDQSCKFSEVKCSRKRVHYGASISLAFTVGRLCHSLGFLIRVPPCLSQGFMPYTKGFNEIRNF
jgi:hypothetical protein